MKDTYTFIDICADRNQDVNRYINQICLDLSENHLILFISDDKLTVLKLFYITY